MSKWEIVCFEQLPNVCCVQRLRWHVNCARSAGVRSGEVHVGSSSAKMLTEHIMHFKCPVFAPCDKKRFFWNCKKVKYLYGFMGYLQCCQNPQVCGVGMGFMGTGASWTSHTHIIPVCHPIYSSSPTSYLKKV